MRPDQIGEYRTPSDPRIHPDGLKVAFVVTQMDLEEDRYVRRIWLWEGDEARPLTSGPSDTSPRWSPDGSQLAFLRKGEADHDTPQVAILPPAGEATVVTSFPLGVSALEWAPDGSELAVIASDWTEDWADLEDEERARKPRRIKQLPYRFDNRGWLHDRRAHIYLVDPNGSAAAAAEEAGADAARCLTSGDFYEGEITWNPDGSAIAFTSERHENRGVEPGNQVWVVPRKGGEAVAATPLGIWGVPSYDHAGQLYAIGRDDVWAWPYTMPLVRINEDGTTTDLTGPLDRNLVSFAPPLAPAGPQWLEDGSALSTLEDAGRLRVIRIASDGTTEDVVGGDRFVTGVSPRPDGSAFAFAATPATDPGELWWWEDGEITQLTSLNESFREQADLVEPETFTIEHEGVAIAGWVYLPPVAESGGAEDGTVPILLNIHGGPATQYGYGFFDEFQVYVGAGYGVVATNPRGSSGYGSDHVRAVVGVWAEDDPPDLRDVRAAIPKAAQQFPSLDTSRLGVMGGSYGGLMTVRVLAHDQTFRSAVAERGLYHWVSFSGTSDIGPTFDRGYLKAQLPDDWETLWRASPFSIAHRIETPTLIIHSANDYRTPIEQGEQLFTLLRRLGVETELVRFPDEGHELSRGGKPKHRKERFEIILEWHAEHL